MNGLSSLWEKLTRSKKYRESFVASVVKRMIPLQIRVLRKQRDWSQAQLATESKLTQGVISRAEDPDYGNLTVNTLVRIASGFDCAFVGRFVPFSELCRWYSMLEHENALRVPSFDDDAGFGMTDDLSLDRITQWRTSTDSSWRMVTPKESEPTQLLVLSIPEESRVVPRKDMNRAMIAFAQSANQQW